MELPDELKTRLLILGLAVAGVVLLIVLIYALRPKNQYPYSRAPILTDHEFAFYQLLRPVCERNGWQILIKMRLADIMKVDEGTSDYMQHFNRIKAKHTDFVLCDPDTLEVLAGIELDDASHSRPDRMERDEFVDGAYEAAGIPLLHLYTPIRAEELEKQLKNVI